MKILFLTLYDEQWASSRIRVYQYLPIFQYRGIEYKVLPIITKDFSRYGTLRYYLSAGLSTVVKWLEVIFLGSKYDTIFIDNVFLPLHMEKLIKAANKNIIYSFSDAFYVGYDTNYVARDPVRMLLGRLGKTWVSRMLKISSHAVVENEQNKQFASRFCQNVSVITGPIDTESYVPRERKKSDSSNIVIGWIGSPSTTPYAKSLGNVFRMLCKSYPNVVVELVGAAELQIEGVPMVIRKWDFASEVNDLQNFDIGIMPLPNNEWTRGKGGYKLLQYMACGIPCVASPVGINSEIIKDGFNGFLARSEQEWIERLSLLIENPGLRWKMGENGRAIAEGKYSLWANAPRFLAVFNIS